MNRKLILTGALAALWLAAGPAAAQGRKLGAEPTAATRKLGAFPALELDGERVVGQDLPAISKDGKRVAVLSEQAIGDSGLVNATLLVIDVENDKRLREQPIFDASASDDVEELVAAARQQVRKANKYLKAREWLALESLDVPAVDKDCGTADDADACETVLEIGPHRVRWSEPRLAVNKKLSEYEEWSGSRRCVEPEKIEDEDECEQWCETASRVTAAAVDEQRAALLLGFEYPASGADCAAGPPQWHLVQLPRSKPAAKRRPAPVVAAPLIGPRSMRAKPTGKGQRSRVSEDQRACMDGDGDACQASAEFWDRGAQAKRQAGFARLMYRRACLSAVAEGCRKFAELTVEDDDSKKARKRARRYLEKGCDLGDEESCQELAKQNQRRAR